MLRRERERSFAIEEARKQIATRLRRVCENFAADEFAALVDRIAEIEVRYRLRDDWLMYREAMAHAGSTRRASGLN